MSSTVEEKKDDALSPSSSFGHEEQDCPICLDVMHPRSDVLHPLQCASSHCEFNMCATCVESLITSSNDDFQEASDGNRHVKVYLHCPNCRSDLGPTIRETLLLRKADFLLLGGGKAMDETELTPSQLRLKGVIDDEDVVKAIADARKREREFFRTKLETEGGPGVRTEGGLDDAEISDAEDEEDGYSSDESVGEWGVEADLAVGVHKSFRVPKHRTIAADDAIGLSTSHSSFGGDVVTFDDTLMGGFETILNDDKKAKVTELLTSGSTSSLAEAAKILHRAIHKPKNAPGVRSKSFIARRNLRSSVYVLIDEAEKARPSPEKLAANADSGAAPSPRGTPKSAARKVGANANAARNANANANANRAAAIQNAQNIAKQQAAARLRAEHLRSYPLPVRMPKYVELIVPAAGAGGTPPLSFVNDEWDGSVADAYGKITVIGRGGLVGAGLVGNRPPRVTKKKVPASSKGVINVLSEGVNPDDATRLGDRIDVPARRVLVAAVRNEAGRNGVVRGDVVTHIDGVEFAGTAEELTEEMARSGPRVNLVLNAERSVAEALRRRALAAARVK